MFVSEFPQNTCTTLPLISYCNQYWISVLWGHQRNCTYMVESSKSPPSHCCKQRKSTFKNMFCHAHAHPEPSGLSRHFICPSPDPPICSSIRLDTSSLHWACIWPTCWCIRSCPLAHAYGVFTQWRITECFPFLILWLMHTCFPLIVFIVFSNTYCLYLTFIYIWTISVFTINILLWV
jgi:hypothetical protein